MPFKPSLPETGTWRVNIAIGTCVPLAYRPQTMRNVLFLFNHDAGHQVAHLAGTAAATARLYPEIACTIACATPAIRERLDTLIPGGDARRLEWVDLTLPLWARAIAAVFDRVLPSSRLLRLRLHRQMFAHSDVVVSTERTCLRVKRHLRREEVPLFVILPHGAGDRSVSYHPDFARFDSVLVAGEKVVDKMVEHGVDRGRLVVVGYPKFETVDLDSQPDFFGNGRPTFVYNPHFDPHLSSWYDCGPDLLRWFASKDGQHFNCIFAPHVMLFRKSLHVSPEYKTSRRRPDVPAEALAAANILIDVDGLRLFDMSYMLAADAYIGDVSSQIYEFLARPRPAFFLDCRDGPDPRDEKWLMFRRAGPTAASVDGLVAQLPGLQVLGEEYRAAQQELFAYTFSNLDRPSSERAAEAIAAVVRQKGS